MVFCFQLFYSFFHPNLTALHALNSYSVINTLVLQMENRIGKCPRNLQILAMPCQSIVLREKPLRRADVAVSSAPQHLSPWHLHSALHGTREGGYGQPLPWPCGFLAMAHAKHMLYWRCTTRAVLGQGRGVCELHRWGMACMTPASCPGMGQLRRTVALEVLLHYLPKSLSYTCTGAFFDTATNG